MAQRKKSTRSRSKRSQQPRVDPSTLRSIAAVVLMAAAAFVFPDPVDDRALELPAPYGDLRPRLSFGLGCWHKGDDMRTLLRRTLDDLRENSDAR